MRHALRQQRIAYKRLQEVHVQVDQPSEHETHHELEQLHKLEPLAEHQDLARHKHEVHDDGVRTDGQCGGFADVAGEREHERRGGDDTAAKTGLDAQHHTERHQIEGTEQQHMLPYERLDF